MVLVPDHNRKVFVVSNLIQVIALHVIGIGLGFYYFSWGAMVFALATMFLFGYSMGIFHHMQLTHSSFKSVQWVQNLGSLFGTLTWRGPFANPVRYVAMHKIHHAHADTDLDPHSPVHGKMHALLTWFWNMPYGFTKYELYRTYAPEFDDKKFITFLDKNTHLVQLIWAVFCFLGGAFYSGQFDLENGMRFLVFGVFVRGLMSIYLINAVDLVNHTIGYRNYDVKDQSTNSFLMAAVHLGGAISWHNNHHAHQHYFHVKRRWWEFDVHHQFLRALSTVGLVSDILILDESKEPKK